MAQTLLDAMVQTLDEGYRDRIKKVLDGSVKKTDRLKLKKKIRSIKNFRACFELLKNPLFQEGLSHDIFKRALILAKSYEECWFIHSITSSQDSEVDQKALKKALRFSSGIADYKQLLPCLEYEEDQERCIRKIAEILKKHGTYS